MNIAEPYQLMFEKLQAWFTVLMQVLPNILAALLVFVFFYLLGVMLSKVFDRYVGSRFHSVTVADLTSFAIRLFLIIVGLLFAIGVLGLHKTVISILAGAGLAGIALGLAFQEIAINIVSGVILGVKKPFKRNDLIKVGDVFGVVKKLDLRVTTLEGRDHEMIYVPNKNMLQSTVYNYSSSCLLRKKIEVSVSYGDDLEKAIGVIKQAVEALDFVKKENGVKVFALAFGDYGVSLSVIFWYNFPYSEVGFREAEHLAILAIKKALDQNGVTIPFPIRTLDFGVKGGRTLSDEMKKK